VTAGVTEELVFLTVLVEQGVIQGTAATGEMETVQMDQQEVVAAVVVEDVRNS
jgi:hypothetical protein